ncbi:unnamed protein product [Amoebophrya sp. A25]|nr:unnamed protein product [Amoebophrya sp. A25]|eukprot:GSA25T00016008001.1
MATTASITANGGSANGVSLSASTAAVTSMKPPELCRVFKGHTGAVSAASFHPLMHQLISGSHDGRVYVWHFKQQLRPFKFDAHKGAVNDIAVSRDGTFFASASVDKTVNLWMNNAKGTPSHVIKAHTGVVRSCDLSPDNGTLATGSDDKIVKIWQITPSSAKFITSLEGHTHWVRSVRFSSENPSLLTSCGDDKSVRIWDLRLPTTGPVGAHSAGGGKDRGCVMKMTEHAERVNRSIFHPDGTCIASCSDDRTIKIWDLRRRRLIQHYDAHGGAVLDLDFCHSKVSGFYLASASTDRNVKLWDLQEGRLLYTLAGHEDSVCSVKFSPQGQFLVSGSADSKIFVWKTGCQQASGTSDQEMPVEQLYEQPPPDGRGHAYRTYLYNAPGSGTAPKEVPDFSGDPMSTAFGSSFRAPPRTATATTATSGARQSSSSRGAPRSGSNGRSRAAAGDANGAGANQNNITTHFENEVGVNADTRSPARRKNAGAQGSGGSQNLSQGSTSKKGGAPPRVNGPTLLAAQSGKPAAAKPAPAMPTNHDPAEAVMTKGDAEKLMDTMRQMSSQMEMLTQTVKVMDQRLSLTEAAIARLETEKSG